jgi:predicted DNA-binding protein with PD1-like motif
MTAKELGQRAGTAHGGHVLRATVRPTLEIRMRAMPAYLRKRHDPSSGLPLIDLSQ